MLLPINANITEYHDRVFWSHTNYIHSVIKVDCNTVTEKKYHCYTFSENIKCQTIRYLLVIMDIMQKEKNPFKTFRKETYNAIL